MRTTLCFLLSVLPMMAMADGFALTDFRKVTVEQSRFSKGNYEIVTERERIILACESCDDLTSVSFELGRSTDGTEGRFRSGETTVAKMRGICRQRDPACELERVDLGPAVGWVTQYELGGVQGSTVILFLDGDLLTIRALSESRKRVRNNVKAALRHIAPQIIGSK
jgi:hypothetical protein